MKKETEDNGGETKTVFYKKREKIYPREVKGVFARLRSLSFIVLLGAFYLLPWINVGGIQSLLFDIPDRKFHVFGLTLWPQDFFYLAVILIIAALTLFFVTAMAGRLWCGYACPQTVYTEIFLWIERRIEGNRLKQIKLDKAPWTAEKYMRKGFKHFAWIFFSLWTGLTFVGYFTPIRELIFSALSFRLGPWETFWLLFYGFATYGNAGWLREQVCIYMCPYARFQSAMFEKDTLIISYDEQRGEPRGSRKKKADHEALGLGSCVDCSMCVQACPTGIDIRDGLQYQCIGCAACVDICDEVMGKMGYEKGLVRYTTEHALEGNATHLFRPRVIIYALLLLGITVALIISILNRIPLELNIVRDRNALYRESGEGLIENVYTLKVLNMDDNDHQYMITIEGLEGIRMVASDGTDMENISVKSEEIKDLTIMLQVDPEKIPEVSNTVFFHVQAIDKPELKQEENTTFIGPAK